MKLFNMKYSEQPLNRKKSTKQKDETIIQSSGNIITDNSLDKIKTLEELRDYIKNFDSPLKTTANSTVISSGPSDSPIMIIGEAPGAEEDYQGLPFVGRSGKLINQELAKLNIDRNKVYVSNIVNWRPENNRTPTLEEIEIFKPIIIKHIELINPKYLVLLGSTSMNALYKSDLSISKNRGKLINYKNDTKIIITFHPSYILRAEKNRVFLQSDFKLLADELIKNDLMKFVTL